MYIQVKSVEGKLKLCKNGENLKRHLYLII